jgi:type IV pilus assembly protein PilM
VASRVVGLDIGTSGVRAAELTLARGTSTLERFGQVTLPVGAVRDGEVVDVPVVAAAIRQLWTQAKFSTKKVVVGVANQKVVVRQVELPWLPDADMRASLSFQVQDFIPMPVEQAILDFHPLEEFTNDAGARMLRILLVAAARDMVNGVMEATQQAGLSAHTVDLTSFAVLRSLVSLDSQVFDSSTAEALIDVGANVTNIVIHQNGLPRFVRILMMGGSDITDSVAERLGVPVEQAEAVKQQTGMSVVPGAAEAHPAQRAIDATGGAFVDEVRSTLDFFMTQGGAPRIGRVTLSGGGSRLTGLTDRLSAATRLPVQAARPMTSMKIGKTGLTPAQLAYVEPLVAVPVGLALGVAS